MIRISTPALSQGDDDEDEADDDLMLLHLEAMVGHFFSKSTKRTISVSPPACPSVAPEERRRVAADLPCLLFVIFLGRRPRGLFLHGCFKGFFDLRHMDAAFESHLLNLRELTV